MNQLQLMVLTEHFISSHYVFFSDCITNDVRPALSKKSFIQRYLKNCICTLAFENRFIQFMNLSFFYEIGILSWIMKIRGSFENILDFTLRDWNFDRFEASINTYWSSGNCSVLAIISKQILKCVSFMSSKSYEHLT